MATVRVTLVEDGQMTTTEVEIDDRTAVKIFVDTADKMGRAAINKRRKDKRKAKAHG